MVEVHGRAAGRCGRGVQSAGEHEEDHGAARHLHAGAGEAVVPAAAHPLRVESAGGQQGSCEAPKA
eukprot:10389413-Heterocapsa_arctica.AAC.1